MKSNTRVLLHDGRSSFLFSNWTGLGELQYLALSDFSSLEPFCVRDFFQDGGWDFDRFRHLFPSEVLESISAAAPQWTDAPDQLVWEPDFSGSFSIASAYSTLRPRREPQPFLDFIWHCHLPAKCSLFFWRLLNSFLPFS